MVWVPIDFFLTASPGLCLVFSPCSISLYCVLSYYVTASIYHRGLYIIGTWAQSPFPFYGDCNKTPGPSSESDWAVGSHYCFLGRGWQVVYCSVLSFCSPLTRCMCVVWKGTGTKPKMSRKYNLKHHGHDMSAIAKVPLQLLLTRCCIIKNAYNAGFK